MAAKDDGGAAFPAPGVWGDENVGHACLERGELGMSVRDYFAAHAMQGLLAGGSVVLPFTEGYETGMETAAMRAYRMADAMLAERAK